GRMPSEARRHKLSPRGHLRSGFLRIAGAVVAPPVPAAVDGGSAGLRVQNHPMVGVRPAVVAGIAYERRAAGRAVLLAAVKRHVQLAPLAAAARPGHIRPAAGGHAMPGDEGSLIELDEGAG